MSKQVAPSFRRLSLMVTGAVAVAGSIAARGSDLYVAPNGTSAGPGTQSQPYDLQTALAGSVGQPGDTFWLRGGIYALGHVDTQVHGLPGRPITFRQIDGQRAQWVGSFTVWGEGGYLIFRDFELCSGVPCRLSRQTGVEFHPTDLTNFLDAIQVYAPNCSFINLVVHDSVRSGFYTSHEATNTLIYGCIVYNAGWASPDNAEGHSLYIQGSGDISDNIAFNSSGANFHIYDNGAGRSLQNLTVDGNVAFGAGALQNARPYRDWIVGVDAPSVKADHIVLRNNMGYFVSNSTKLPEVQIGREQFNGEVVLRDNYWPQAVALGKWAKADISNTNDSASARVHPSRKGTKVFVRPNRYAPGRATIVVYNWDKLSKVAIEAGPVLSIGAKYEVRNAEDFFAPAVLKGTFDGHPLQLPMTGLTVAKPMCELKTAQPTGPTFNVFVLLSNTNQSVAAHARSADQLRLAANSRLILE